MKLSRTSKLAQFCYLGQKMPKSTTLCAFFWQCFVIMPIACATLIGLAGSFFWFIVIPDWFAFSMVFGLFGLIGVFLYFYGERIKEVVVQREIRKQNEYWDSFNKPRVRKKSLVERILDSFFIQGLISLKKKFCPIIELS